MSGAGWVPCPTLDFDRRVYSNRNRLDNNFLLRSGFPAANPWFRPGKCPYTALYTPIFAKIAYIRSGVGPAARPLPSRCRRRSPPGGRRRRGQSNSGFAHTAVKSNRGFAALARHGRRRPRPRPRRRPRPPLRGGDALARCARSPVHPTRGREPLPRARFSRTVSAAVLAAMRPLWPRQQPLRFSLPGCRRAGAGKIEYNPPARFARSTANR